MLMLRRLIIRVDKHIHFGLLDIGDIFLDESDDNLYIKASKHKAKLITNTINEKRYLKSDMIYSVSIANDEPKTITLE